MASIFELAGQYKQLYDMLTDCEEDEEDVIENTIEGVVEEIAVKGDSYIAVCNHLDMEIDACKKQVAYWQKQLKVRENGLKRLKERLTAFLTMMGTNEIRTNEHTIKLVNNGGIAPLRFSDGVTSDIPIEEVDIQTIPKEYRKVEVKEKPDSEKIRKALDSGKQLDFVRYGERGKRLKF